MTELMPRDRLATIIADATARAAAQVTGIFRNERMTWTEQGVHAAAWNAIMHDDQVQTALRMLKTDGAVEYEANRPAEMLLTATPSGASVPVQQVLRVAGKSDDALVIIEALRFAWMDVPFDDPLEKDAHHKAFDDAIRTLMRRPIDRSRD